MTEERGEFSVWAFEADGWHIPVARWLDAESAVRLAKRATERLSFPRIIITDALDTTVFEWRRGEGVTWPKQEAGDGG